MKWCAPPQTEPGLPRCHRDSLQAPISHLRGTHPPQASHGPAAPPCGRRQNDTWIHGVAPGRRPSAIHMGKPSLRAGGGTGLSPAARADRGRGQSSGPLCSTQPQVSFRETPAGGARGGGTRAWEGGPGLETPQLRACGTTALPLQPALSTCF